MKKTWIAMLALCAAWPALADPKLAEKKNCLTCHGMKEKIVGPAFKDVAAKYAGQPDAVKTLTEKVLKGGSGVWGPVPMPPNDVTPAEATTLVTWLLGSK